MKLFLGLDCTPLDSQVSDGIESQFFRDEMREIAEYDGMNAGRATKRLYTKILFLSLLFSNR
jgi:hypothetical protein